MQCRPCGFGAASSLVCPEGATGVCVCGGGGVLQTGLRNSLPWLSSGVVTKMKMQRTVVIRRDYLHYIRKYNRFEKRHKNMSVHLSPCFR